jgi:hypothetical protein
LTASIEVLPSDDPRQSRHELGFFPEIGETQCAPKPSEQGQAEEFTPLGGRQPEDRREVTKERDFLRPDRRLYRPATAKELEPSRVHALRRLDVAAKHRIVDKPLRAVETPSTDFCGEMQLELTLDRSDQVRHYARPVRMPEIGSPEAVTLDLTACAPGAPEPASGSRQ